MSRGQGGYIGFNRVPAAAAINSAASGVWSLREAEALKRAGTWPNSPAGGVTPDNISGLQLWLDASDSATLFNATSGGSLVAANGGVARWEDKSGNGRHATQSTSANRPARKTAVQGGKDVLRFDGSNDSMSIASSTATFKFLHSTQATVFFASKVGNTSDPNDFYVFIATGDGATAQSGTLFYYDDRVAIPFNNRVRYVVTTGSDAAVVAGADNNFTPNVFSVVSAVVNAAAVTAADRAALRVNNGSPDKSNTSTNSPSTANSVANLTIGATADSLVGNLDGDICEIIIYDSALSDTDRAAIETYLVAKWGIT